MRERYGYPIDVIFFLTMRAQIWHLFIVVMLGVNLASF